LKASSDEALLDIDCCELRIAAGNYLRIIGVIDVEGVAAAKAGGARKHCDFIIVFLRSWPDKSLVYILSVEAGLHSIGEYSEKLSNCSASMSRFVEALLGGEPPKRYRHAFLVLIRARQSDPLYTHLARELEVHVKPLRLSACGSTLAASDIISLFRKAG